MPAPDIDLTKKYYTSTVLASKLGISRKTLWRWVHKRGFCPKPSENRFDENGNPNHWTGTVLKNGTMYFSKSYYRALYEKLKKAMKDGPKNGGKPGNGGRPCKFWNEELKEKEEGGCHTLSTLRKITSLSLGKLRRWIKNELIPAPTAVDHNGVAYFSSSRVHEILGVLATMPRDLRRLWV